MRLPIVGAASSVVILGRQQETAPVWLRLLGEFFESLFHDFADIIGGVWFGWPTLSGKPDAFLCGTGFHSTPQFCQTFKRPLQL